MRLCPDRNPLKMWTHGLEGRNREVLAVIIRTYIATGQPVGSLTISHRRRDRLSPATIRNTMADLEAAGYLRQPHTSAGRIPTGKAYQFYVEHLARPVRHLPRKEEERIRREIQGTTEGPQAILERASHVLSRVTHNIGIVVSATASDTVLEHIEFVRLAERRVLVLLAPRGSPARSRVVRVEEEFHQDELDRVANYLNCNFAGWRLAAARNEITRLMQEERARYDELLRRLAKLWRLGILESDASAGVYLEGTSHLMGRPELDNPQVLRDLLRALEEKERLVQLITRYIQEAESPEWKQAQVVIGLDTDPPMQDFALVGAPCITAGGLAGRVAVLGPPRMPYERVISAVSEVARQVGEAIGQH